MLDYTNTFALVSSSTDYTNHLAYTPALISGAAAADKHPESSRGPPPSHSLSVWPFEPNRVDTNAVSYLRSSSAPSSASIRSDNRPNLNPRINA